VSDILAAGIRYSHRLWSKIVGIALAMIPHEPLKRPGVSETIFQSNNGTGKILFADFNAVTTDKSSVTSSTIHQENAWDGKHAPKCSSKK
jgi:hypothetical protein